MQPGFGRPGGLGGVVRVLQLDPAVSRACPPIQTKSVYGATILYFRDVQPTQALPPPADSSLTIISSPIILTVPQRCSRRLAAKVEQAGGRLVYSHTDTPRVILR